MLAAAAVLALVACAPAGAGDQARAGDAAGDRPVSGDAAGDGAGALAGDAGPSVPPLSGSAASRAAGFGLLYRERVNRILTGLNRLTMVGDSLGAINIGHLRLQRDGQRWEVLAGPNDNNAIGRPIYQAAWAWRGLGGRALELTLLRQLEGLVFVEAVSGHPGLTNRMALPGWTRTMDGIGLQVLRLRAGSPVASPAAPDQALEREVLETFFGGVQVTFHEDPAEFYFSRHPVGRLEEWALTFVFEELPDWLRISDCCASFLATPAGPWAGAWWSNHNSRDNFSDLALGYLTALDLADEPGLSAELRAAAQRAAAAGRRVGDHIVAAGNVLLTVSEHGPYEQLVPAGAVRPDGQVEDSDLGTLNTCLYGYLARALSSAGLDAPLPLVTLRDSPENMAFVALLGLIGAPDLPPAVTSCAGPGDVLLGYSWHDLLAIEVQGVPWHQAALAVAGLYPELFPRLVGSALDDFSELLVAAAALVYYGELSARPALTAQAKAVLADLLALQGHLADLLDAGAGGPSGQTRQLRYAAALLAASHELPVQADHIGSFAPGQAQAAAWEALLAWPDTPAAPLLGDQDIRQRIAAELQRKTDRGEHWIVSRYLERFALGPPLRRAGAGYEALGPGGWQPTAADRHQAVGMHELFAEARLCWSAPQHLACDWARLGCAAADLDGSSAVDGQDAQLLEQAMAAHGGGPCGASNQFCGGADLDRDADADSDDRDFMAAAQGCWY